MSTPLLNCFIFVCKLMICISIFLSIGTHHWIRDYDGEEHRGLHTNCYDYGHSCEKGVQYRRALWFFNIIVSINLILESLNLLLLYKRTRSCINLILEELGLLASIIFILPTALVSVAGFIMIRRYDGETFDWSFYIFLLSLVLALIEFTCSLVRAVSYCRDNSFRSSVITYTSNNNDERVHIQT